jgi:DNA-binding GntR family transcriptional regulator
LRLGEIRECMAKQHRALASKSGRSTNERREYAIKLVDSIAKQSLSSKVRALVDRVAKRSDDAAAEWMFEHYRDLEAIARA